MASLQAALKHAIQVQYQLEDDELAAEPLPSADDRHLILLYESAEGGAGVLRQLLDRPDGLCRSCAAGPGHVPLRPGHRRRPAARPTRERRLRGRLLRLPDELLQPAGPPAARPPESSATCCCAAPAARSPPARPFAARRTPGSDSSSSATATWSASGSTSVDSANLRLPDKAQQPH